MDEGYLCDICERKVRDSGCSHCLCRYRGKTKKRRDECNKFIDVNYKPVSVAKVGFLDAIERGAV